MNLLSTLHKHRQQKKELIVNHNQKIPPTNVIRHLATRLNGHQPRQRQACFITKPFQPYVQYSALGRILHVEYQTLEIRLVLMRNQRLVHCTNHTQQILMIRYFNVANGGAYTNNIYLHGRTKQIVCQHFNAIFGRSIRESQLVSIILEQVASMYNRMAKCLPQIMLLLNQRRVELHSVLENAENRQNLMLNIVKMLEDPNSKKSTKDIHEIIYNFCSEPPKYTKFIDRKMSLSNQQIEKFKMHYAVKISQTSQRPQILSLIRFTEQPRFEAFEQTTFSKLSYANCTFGYLKDSQGPASRKIVKMIVKKQNLTQSHSNNRIASEHNCLLTIGKLQCMNVVRYYYLEETKNKEIYSQYCSFKSFDRYQQNYHLTLSLLTKIFLLCQCVQGLRFLNDNKIIHADVKLANILISRNLSAKLCDFADSIVNGRNHCTGVTPIFSAPEVYNGSKSKIDQKIDVYSFGVVMFKVLFGQYPYDITVETVRQFSKIMTTQMKASERTRLMVEKLTNEGPSQLMELLLRTTAMCLQEDPQQRISLDCVIIVLRISMSYLVKLS